jgi:hypothetical protein
MMDKKKRKLLCFVCLFVIFFFFFLELVMYIFIKIPCIISRLSLKTKKSSHFDLF